MLFQALSPLHATVSANLGSRMSGWLFDSRTETCLQPPGYRSRLDVGFGLVSQGFGASRGVPPDGHRGCGRPLRPATSRRR